MLIHIRNEHPQEATIKIKSEVSEGINENEMDSSHINENVISSPSENFYEPSKECKIYSEHFQNVSIEDCMKDQNYTADADILMSNSDVLTGENNINDTEVYIALMIANQNRELRRVN